MADKSKGPAWGYKMEDGKVVSRLFPDGAPDGWKDSPAKCVREKPQKIKRAKKGS